MTTDSYISPESHSYEGGANRTEIGIVQRSAEHRAKLVKFFRLRLEAHAHGVAVREFSEDRRFLRDRIKQIGQERDQVVEHLRSRPADQTFSRLGRLNADMEELAVEIQTIDEAIEVRKALVDPLRHLLTPMRDLLRKIRMDIPVRQPSSTELIVVSNIPIYSDAHGVD